VYQYKDHLGNVRLSYSDTNGDGQIAAATEILEENNYYPFGLKHKGYNNNPVTNHPYQYNGKELNEELGLDWYDYGWRNYDAALGRWFGIDNLAEQYYDLSTYTYCTNNPVRFIDIDGNEFTDAAWEWVNGLISDINKRQNNNNKKIAEKQAMLDAGGLNDRKVKSLNRQIKRLNNTNNELEATRGEIATLAASDQVYNVTVSDVFSDSEYSKGAAIYNQSTSAVDIVLPSDAKNNIFAHELKHAHQFETGEISLSSHDGTYDVLEVNSYLAYDQADEIAAYKRQGLFGTTQSSLPSQYLKLPKGPTSVKDVTTIGNINLKNSSTLCVGV
jgi:RHS repeat-associated protein